MNVGRFAPPFVTSEADSAFNQQVGDDDGCMAAASARSVARRFRAVKRATNTLS
ncbi:MAG TPA: hypothetical protein VF666_11715 [Pyrinomonadaceae bacterium]